VTRLIGTDALVFDEQSLDEAPVSDLTDALPAHPYRREVSQVGDQEGHGQIFAVHVLIYIFVNKSHGVGSLVLVAVFYLSRRGRGWHGCTQQRIVGLSGSGVVVQEVLMEETRLGEYQRINTVTPNMPPIEVSEVSVLVSVHAGHEAYHGTRRLSPYIVSEVKQIARQVKVVIHTQHSFGVYGQFGSESVI